ncbi:response regulator transcription factor [Methyloterricola oryzae]|uniref:response regulator transcription factor n=1 Tax=Methyloterricola oryzae TaxID=1495050 RepID=UPI0006999458|nr:response regulator [Methyloterricola oryzae]
MLKALVVEDSYLYRELLCSLLVEQYPDIIIATTGEGSNLMALIEEFVPHIVFMDIKLPGVNGLQLTRSIHQTYPELPVVILTSYSDEDYRLAALAAGASSFIPKDELDDDKIAALLASVVAARQLINVESHAVVEGGATAKRNAAEREPSASVPTALSEGSVAEPGSSTARRINH